MIIIKNIHGQKIDELMTVSKAIKGFNSLNEDFWELYKKSSKINRYLLRKQCKIIYKGKKMLAFVWSDSFKKPSCCLKALYLHESLSMEELRAIFKSIFKYSVKVMGKSAIDDKCNEYFKRAGFVSANVIDEMQLYLIDYKCEKISNPSDDSINIRSFIDGMDEFTRCKLQNSIFASDERIPLSIQDIEIDKLQSYYIPDGSFFLKCKNKFVGYGQLIFYEGYLNLVNFGVLREYRQKGYGRYFLNYILEQAKEMGYVNVRLKVNTTNKNAVKLYEGLGFERIGTYIEWKLEIKH